MSETKELTFSDIAEHNTKKDLYLVIHDKVYDATKFVDEHPYVVYPSSNPRFACAADFNAPEVPLGGFRGFWRSGGGLSEGGEEGQDATEAFEDVGHSDEARTILEGLVAGNLKRVVLVFPLSHSTILPATLRKEKADSGDPEPPAEAPTATTSQPSTSSGDAGMGVMFYALVLVGGALAFGAYEYLQAKSASEGK
ncbi:MAG: hypothetical protein Q9170_003684 [Blastenia crenularia]